MKRKILYMIAIIMIFLYILFSKLIMPVNDTIAMIWIIIAGCFFVASFFVKN